MSWATIWFFAFLATFIYSLYQWLNKPDISVKKALKLLKNSLIKLIVFYQSNYSASDQIELVKKWIDSIKINEVPKEQLELFKEFINNLKSE